MLFIPIPIPINLMNLIEIIPTHTKHLLQMYVAGLGNH